MKHGSSCMPREPARGSTHSRSNSKVTSTELKNLTFNNLTPCKQQFSTRPHPRQWTSWSAESNTFDEATISIQPVSDSDSTPKPFTASRRTSLTTGPKAASFSTSHDTLKTLPTRPKVASSQQQHQQTRCSVEENKLRNTIKLQSDAAIRSNLAINRPAPAIEVNVARSRCHPRRRPCSDAVTTATPKLRRDTDCTEAIVRLIVFFSTKLVHTTWSQASDTPKSSKDFNGAGVLPLQVFIQETLRRSKTSYSTLQVALFYLILLRPHVRPCQTTQQQYTPGCRALQCGRRMFLTALILASKYLQDRNYSARAWSKISGLPVAEINENERRYLELIKYNLHMSKDTFENWSKVVLSICKASGQGPFSRRQDSPPSSPDALLCSAEFEPGSSGWWSYHLIRLTPEMIKDSKMTEEYLLGLATGVPYIDTSLSLGTPPASPESLEEALSTQSSPLVIPSSASCTGPASVSTAGFEGSPAPVLPSRPLPQNLPTPQTTPRYDSAFTFSRQSSQTDLRCRASVQALAGVEKQAFSQANLETCPPPKPRSCAAAMSGANHPLREFTETSVTSWMSSPESSYSDSSSATTRSRSSSISSVSSVWSIAGNCTRPVESKSNSQPRTETRPQCPPSQPPRSNIGGYSFYHHVGNMQPIPEHIKPYSRVSGSTGNATVQHGGTPRSVPCQPTKPVDLNEDQIANLLASLSSQSDGQVQQRSVPAAIREPGEPSLAKVNVGPSKKHKRNRPSKEDCVLQEEVRQFLWNEQSEVCVEDDKSPTAYVETSDKEAQFPLQDWAHPKKPVPNAMHTKRIALQHTSPSEHQNASQLAADYIRQSVAVM